MFNLKFFLFIHDGEVLERRWYFKEVRRFSSCHIKRSLSLGVAKNSSVCAPCLKKLIMELCRREEREGDSAQITSLSCYQTKRRSWYILSRGWRNKSSGYMQTPKVHTWPTQQVLKEGESIFYPQYLPRFSSRDCLFSSRVKYSNIFQHLSIHPFDHHTTHICIAGTRKLGPLTYISIAKQIKEVRSWGPGSH